MFRPYVLRYYNNVEKAAVGETWGKKRGKVRVSVEVGNTNLYSIPCFLKIYHQGYLSRQTVCTRLFFYNLWDLVLEL